jgi:hypothetical protein
MNVLITESLYLLNHASNEDDTSKQELLYSSTNKHTPGQAYSIDIQDFNTGYSNLSFKMPRTVLTLNGEQIHNPKLELLKPLSKVRYQRIVRYMGTDKIAVPNPSVEGGVEYFPKNEGKHPNDFIMEDYVMDYIIEPLQQSRQSSQIDMTYTAIDYPRFSLSKKRLGLTFGEQTITTPDLSLYKNEPLSSPGSIQYIRWNNKLAGTYQATLWLTPDDLQRVWGAEGEIAFVREEGKLYVFRGYKWYPLEEDNELTTWIPNAQEGTYPLSDSRIKQLVKETEFTHGMLATIYYWPILESGRFEGVHYEKGGFITLSLYNTYAGSDWQGSEYLEDITWKWGALAPMENYLAPNTACHYLQYILQNTNWKVKGNKDLFIANSPERPYFLTGERPTGKIAKNSYYIEYYKTDSEETMKVYRYDREWKDETEDGIGHVVNTAINFGTMEVGEDFGTLYDVDIEMIETNNNLTPLTEACYNLSVENSNCYNAITTAAKVFDLYPIFDCRDHTVTLKLHAGSNYGLTYKIGENIKGSSVTADGEKVITKLYVTGGTDAQGSQKITIGEASRSIAAYEATYGSSRELGAYQSQVQALANQMFTELTDHYIGSDIHLNLVMKEDFDIMLKFPDDLYKDYLGEKDPPTDTQEHVILEGKTGSIKYLYNPTGSDFCLYIYVGDDYKDETKQLYKYDASHMKIRRNKVSCPGEWIGKVMKIAYDSPAASYLKYRDPLPTFDNKLDGHASIDYNGDYIAYVGLIAPQEVVPPLELDITQDTPFLLKGPEKVVYNVGTTFKHGHYYWMDDKCYMVLSSTPYTSPDLPNIVVPGYLFCECGTKDTPVEIDVYSDGSYTKVYKRDGSPVTWGEWASGYYAIHAIYKGTGIYEIDAEFDPNGPEFLIARSPYGTSYIYNFKYAYDNKWITEEEIRGIYDINLKIHEENMKFYDTYIADLTTAQAMYDDACNNYDLYSVKGDSQLEAMMNQYFVDPNRATKGHFSAFPGMPIFSDGRPAEEHYDAEKKMYWEQITYEEDDGTIVPVNKVYFNVFGYKGTRDTYPHAGDNQTKANNPDEEGQYNEVIKALGWEKYILKGLPLNDEQETLPPELDPSKTIDSYNRFVKNMKDYYHRALIADKQMVEAMQRIDKLAEDYKVWEAKVNEYEKELQTKYGHFIIEGSYSDDEQPYANLLLADGLEASDKYCVPKVTYNVNVIDTTGLIEYRAPQLHVYNHLVKRLHGVGQLVPKPGDYVAIHDEKLGMFGVSGLITQITRRLDKPIDNSVTIDTAYTDAEELVGSIITATNTVLNNKDIYGRAAIINKNGELQTSTVTNALSSGQNTLSIISNSGKVLVDNNGLTCVNPTDNFEMMRYNGAGIYTSATNGLTWKELVSPNGINANYINAGNINATKVAITDGEYDLVALDGNGLVVKESPGLRYLVGNFNPETYEPTGWENVKAYVGKTKDGTAGIGYFDGYINASSGGNIGGWKIVPSGSITHDAGLYQGSLDAPKIYLGTGLKGQTFGENTELNLMIKAQDQFAVTTEGKLFAKNADITGKITTDLLTANGGNIKDITGENITVKSGEFTGTLKATTGTIGNWELNVEITELDAKKRKLSAIRNTNGNAAIEVKCNGKYAGIKSSSGSAFYAGANGPANGGDGKTSTAAFSVSHDGILYASGATITGNSTFKGTLDAAGGTFSGKLDAVDGTFTGTLSGVDGDFTGTITADKLVLGKMEWTSDGWTYTDDKKYDGGGKQCFKFDTPWSAKTYWAKFINGIFWGVVPGDKPSGFTDVAK